MTTAPRWQKVLSDLWGSRVRTLLVVASIAVGLFAIGIIATIYSVIAEDMRTGYKTVNAANIYIQADFLDQDMVEHLRKVDGVAEAEGVRTLDLRVLNRSREWQSLRMQAVKDWASMPLNRPIVKQGAWPPGKDEIVFDQYKLPELNVKLGDPVTIEMPDGTTKSLKLVGEVQDLTIGAFGYGGGFFPAPASSYVSLETLDRMDFPTPYDYNGVYVSISGPKDDLKKANDVVTTLTKQIEDNGSEVLSSKATSAYDHPNAYLVNAIVGVLFVLGLLVVFLSGFLITNTLQALLGQQVQQIGIMKSLGARWMQVAGIYMILILIFGLLAFAVSLPTAGQVSFWLLDFLGGKLNFVMQGPRLVPVTVILQAILALIMPQAAAWLPIWKGTRISVQEALSGVSAEVHRSAAGQTQHRTPAERSTTTGLRTPVVLRTARLSPARLRMINRIFTRPLLISLRNTFRRKGRLALTLVTLTLGGAVFISTFNVQVSLGKWMDMVAQYFLCDVNVVFDQPYRVSKIEALIKEVPGVSYVEGWATARSEMIQADGSSGEEVDLMAPPIGSKLVKPVLISGRWLQPGDRNAITLSELFLTRYPKLKLGDTLRLQVNGKDTDWIVVGIFRFAGKNGGFSAYTGYDYLAGLTGQANRAVRYQVIGSKPGMTADEQNRLAQAIEARLKAENIQVADISTGSFLSDVAGGGFNILITFLLFLAVLTALVGSIGLAGTMSMNVMERTREIGVMRAIGASNRMLMRMVLTEGMLIGAISYVLGAVLSFPISKLMADGISLSIFEAYSSFGLTPTGFVIWLVVVIVLSFAASVIPARNAARLTIREVLAYE